MNWEDRLYKPKVGDKVKIIKSPCGKDYCCEEHGYYDKSCEIIRSGKHHYKIISTTGSECSFGRYCFEKAKK